MWLFSPNSFCSRYESSSLSVLALTLEYIPFYEHNPSSGIACYPLTCNWMNFIDLKSIRHFQLVAIIFFQTLILLLAYTVLCRLEVHIELWLILQLDSGSISVVYYDYYADDDDSTYSCFRFILYYAASSNCVIRQKKKTVTKQNINQVSIGCKVNCLIDWLIDC